MRATNAMACALLLAACGSGDGTTEDAAADTAAPAVAVRDTAPAAPAPVIQPVIRADGIGHARIGMRIADLRRMLPDALVLGDLHETMVDISGIPVVQGADTLYYLLFPAGDDVGDNSVIQRLMTAHPAFRTNQGVGPGMTLAQAAAVYGQPTLSYNVDDESREWARFPALPSSLQVRVAPGSDIFGGFYDTSDGYNETTRYDPTAQVWMIFVSGY